jgi:pyruvate kinase
MPLRRTKIACTIGPASREPALLDRLVAAGMDAARLNFSHGSADDARETFARIRQAAARGGRPVAVIADLMGPRVRVGDMPAEGVQLEEGSRLVISPGAQPGSAARFAVTYRDLARDVRPGHRILLDDGRILLEVEEVRGDDVHCLVRDGGRLTARKGVNLPDSRLALPALTEKDRHDLALALDLGVDYLMVSFVRGADDVLEAKRLAGEVPVLAKLERPQAVEALEEIVDVADGVVVARGDLGVELGLGKVPAVQKRTVEACRRHGKLAVVATQLLDSMMREPTPTRAEVADIANAVLEGADALLLTGETAAGPYPVEATRVLAAIALDAEEAFPAQRPPVLDVPVSTGGAIARAAALASDELALTAIVAYTRSGNIARRLSGARPRAPILALTHRLGVARRLALVWGAVPREVELLGSTDEMVARVEREVISSGLAAPGNVVAVVLGVPTSGEANLLKLHRIGAREPV